MTIEVVEVLIPQPISTVEIEVPGLQGPQGEPGSEILSGNGSPEGAVTAAVGNLYLRLDGGRSMSIYRKESGSGNTGWANRSNLAVIPELIQDGASDDGGAINDVIEYFSATNGGTIIIPPGTCALSTTILNVGVPNLRILAVGSDVRHNNPQASQASTIFKWIGASGGTMMQFTSEEGGTTRIYGGGVEGIYFNANGLAGKGLEILSAIGVVCRDLHFQEFLTAGLNLDLITDSTESRNVNHCTFDTLTFYQGAQSGDCVAMGLAAPGSDNNVCNNQFLNIVCNHKNGRAFVLGATDHNDIWARCFEISGATANAVEFLGSNVSDKRVSYSNIFRYLSAAGGIKQFDDTEYTYPARGNSVYNADDNNGTSYPVVGTSNWGHWSFASGKDGGQQLDNAASVNVLGQASRRIFMSAGAIPVTSLGDYARELKMVRALGAFTLVHDGVNITIDGSANIDVETGDTFVVEGTVASGARIYNYSRHSRGPDTIPDSALVHQYDLINQISNGDFKKGDVGFNKGGAWTIGSDTTNAYAGYYVATNAAASGSQEPLASDEFQACEPGDVVYAEAKVKTDGSFSGTNLRVQLGFYDKDQAIIGSQNGGTNYTSVQSSYVTSSVTATAPANTAFSRARVLCQFTSGQVWAGKLLSFRKRAIDQTHLGMGTNITGSRAGNAALANLLTALAAAGIIVDGSSA